MKTVSIIGVGLIGGSFALALRKAGFKGKIIGVSSPRTTEEALRLKVIDAALPLEEAVAESDLIYMAQPISRIIEQIEEIDRALKPGALVTDSGSTKAAIVDTARAHIRRGVFLGGHPMAGKESRGVSAADAGLFVDRPYVLTPTEPSDMNTKAAQELLDWVRRIGAQPIVLNPEQHDRLVGLSSHLPQLASTALAAALANSEEGCTMTSVAGPGLRDMTRLALSPYGMWADIVETNSMEIEEALTVYIHELEQIRSSLRSGDLEKQFDRAAGFSNSIREPPSERQTKP